MKQIKKCIICGEVFTKPTNCSRKDWKERKTCSKKCGYDYRSKTNVVWNKGLTKETDKRVKKNAKVLTGIKKDFSNYKGRKHHLFTTGHGLYRKESIKLFGHDCQECGSTRFVETHHIDGNDKNNPKNGSNWMRLCRKCHRRIHRNNN